MIRDIVEALTLQSMKVRTVGQGKVRVSLCIRSSDTVSICSICHLKPVHRKSRQIVDSQWGETTEQLQQQQKVILLKVHVATIHVLRDSLCGESEYEWVAKCHPK